MPQPIRLTKSEVEVLIHNIESVGGDATELKKLSEPTVDSGSRQVHNKGRMQRRGFDPFEHEPRTTTVHKYWELYHKGVLETGTLGVEIAEIENDVGIYLDKKHIKPGLSLSRHASVIATLGECPWTKEVCPCNAFKLKGQCRANIFQ